MAGRQPPQPPQGTKRNIPPPTDQLRVWKYEPHGKGFHITNGDKSFVTLLESDAQWLVNQLGSDGFVRLFCRTPGCKGFGQWITRSVKDVENARTPYTCESGCNKMLTK